MLTQEDLPDEMLHCGRTGRALTPEEIAETLARINELERGA